MSYKEIGLLESWHPNWKLIFTEGVHGYWMNVKTGERKYSTRLGGYSALNRKWLNGESYGKY